MEIKDLIKLARKLNKLNDSLLLKWIKVKTNLTREILLTQNIKLNLIQGRINQLIYEHNLSF